MDTIMLALRVLLSLGAVIALVWLLQKRITKGQSTKRSNSRMRLVARQGIGRRASVVMLEADSITLVLGVTDQSVRLLHTADNPSADHEDSLSDSVPASEPKKPQQSYDEIAAALETPAFARNAALSGSILSPTTWKQAASAFRQAR